MFDCRSHPSPIDVGHPNRPASLLAHRLMSTPLWDSAFSLAHSTVSGSDTICNSTSPPLSDIVLFRLPLNVFKTRLLGRGFHTLTKNASFSSPSDARSHIRYLIYYIIENQSCFQYYFLVFFSLLKHHL